MHQVLRLKQFKQKPTEATQDGVSTESQALQTNGPD